MSVTRRKKATNSVQGSFLPLLGLLALFLLVASFRFFIATGLEDPAPVGAFLNGQLPATLDAEIQVTSTSENANTALAMKPEPQGSRMFVAEQSGRIYTFNPVEDGLAGKTLFMDISDQVLSGPDSGVLGLAFHPEYNQAGSPNSAYFYLYYTMQTEDGDYLRLSRFSGTSTGDVASEFVMIEQTLGDMVHRGGGLLFGDDGFLYLSIGDLGWMELSQSITDRLSGGVLRLDVDQQGGDVSHPVRRTLEDIGWGISGVGYYIPNSNPFLSEAGEVFEEYYSIGSRNPHRMSKDRATGIMYIGNVGSNSGDKREEVNVLAKGANFGWPFREGTLDRPDLMERPEEVIGTLTDPIHEYRHTSGDGCSVIGGYVYRGSKIPALFGQYILTDFCSKKVWTLDVDAGPGAEKQEFLSVEFNPVSFAEDTAGELYIAVQGWHPVFKITAANSGEPGATIPLLLSETGAFSDLSDLTPAAGVIPYDIIAPLWSDGAAKKRWMSIPNDGSHDTPAEQVLYSEEEEWSFPEGSVLIKHFEIALDESNPDDTRRLETRFLVHGAGGQYYAFTYRWNDAGTDAELLDQALVEALTVTEVDGTTRQQDWYYPSRSDCFVCHTSAAGRVLGPKSRQLNNNLTYPVSGLTGNQLESLNHIGVFDPAIDLNGLPGILTSKSITDETATLEERARSYLDANCAGCHRPEGGPRSVFDLRLNVEMSESGLVNGEVIEDLGIEGAKVIVPGDPERSILYQRISEVGTATAMPPLAKSKLDEDAVTLIRDWILALDPLPVELTSFTGLYAEGNVQLKWETASETNNAGFYLERRTAYDAEEGVGAWGQIEFIEGQGTTLALHAYTYWDTQLPTAVPTFEYRLKQIDFDGTFEYSNVVSVAVAAPEALVLHENYPNPFNPSTTISYDLPVEGSVKLTVFDMQGREMQVLVDGRQAAGQHEVVFDASRFASGMYLYQLESGSKKQVKQMLLVK